MQDKLLEQFRTQIDSIDDEILLLLEKRMGLVDEIGKHKKKSYKFRKT